MQTSPPPADTSQAERTRAGEPVGPIVYRRAPSRGRGLLPGRAQVVAALAVVAVLALAGIALGLEWAHTAPRLDIAAAANGSEAALAVQSGVDVHFGLLAAVIGGAAGLLSWLLAWLLLRRHDWLVPVGLALGGWLTCVIGAAVGSARRAGAVRHQLAGVVHQDGISAQGASYLRLLSRFHVRAGGLYLVCAVAALLVYTTLTYLVKPRTKRAGPPPEPTWWSALSER